VTGVEVESAPDPESAVRDADIVCCATTSKEPVFDAAWLRPGTHVNGIGAFNLGMIELPPELFGRASLVAVDAREAALAEAGDLVAGIEHGFVRPGDLVEIGSVDRSWVEARDSDAITVFKSVGLAIQDVAASELITARLLG
jgi:ornithine cyclodeaminase/alanine dehydrogenase-like protein (mu-crystallin family)